MKRISAFLLSLIICATLSQAAWFTPPGGNTSSVNGTDLVLVDQGGVSRMATISEIVGISGFGNYSSSAAQSAVSAAASVLLAANQESNAAAAAAAAAAANTGAIAAQTAAIAAQNAASGSAATAATNATAASTSASSASTSQGQAGASAISAAASVVSAATQAANSASSAAAAVTSASNAYSYQTAAQTASAAATSASTSAGVAGTSASGSAAAAVTSATNASASASGAAGSASSASSSATAAATSASSAGTYATAASTSAGAAASSSTSSGTYAGSAGTQATAAAASAAAALTSASSASAQAGYASTSATNASSYSAAASAASTNASTYAASASGSAGTAVSASSLASGYATAAGTSAATASSAAGVITAQYTIKTDVNGNVAGVGLWNAGTSSGFDVLASEFSIIDASNTAYVPFSVAGGVVTVNGKLNASNITAGTITGSTSQTAATGARVVIDPTDNQVAFFGDIGTGAIEQLVTIGANVVSNGTVMTLGDAAGATTNAGLIINTSSGSQTDLIIHPQPSLQVNNYGESASGYASIAGSFVANNGIGVEATGNTWGVLAYSDGDYTPGAVVNTSSITHAGGGAAVLGYQDGTGGAGIAGVAVSGYGGQFAGNSTAAAVYLVPQATEPTTKTAGGVFYYSGASMGGAGLYVANGTYWQKVTVSGSY